MTKSVIVSQKVQLIEFLVIFFLQFFSDISISSTCARVATHVIFSATGDATIFQKVARIAGLFHLASRTFLKIFSELRKALLAGWFVCASAK